MMHPPLPQNGVHYVKSSSRHWIARVDPKHFVCDRVRELFHSRGRGSSRFDSAEIVGVEFIKNPVQLAAFEEKLIALEERARRREDQAYDMTKERAGRLAILNRFREGNCVITFYGCSSVKALDIALQGAPRDSNESLQFGEGVYGTTSAEYASRFATGEFTGSRVEYAGEEGVYTMVMSSTLVGTTYPLTRIHDYDAGSHISHFHHLADVQGPKPLHPYCDSHYVRISESQGLQAPADNEEGEYDEIIVSSQANVLPHCVIYFRLKANHKFCGTCDQCKEKMQLLQEKVDSLAEEKKRVEKILEKCRSDIYEESTHKAEEIRVLQAEISMLKQKNAILLKEKESLKESIFIHKESSSVPPIPKEFEASTEPEPKSDFSVPGLSFIGSRGSGASGTKTEEPASKPLSFDAPSFVPQLPLSMMHQFIPPAAMASISSAANSYLPPQIIPPFPISASGHVPAARETAGASRGSSRVKPVRELRFEPSIIHSKLQLSSLSHIAIDRNDDIFVVDSGSHMLQVFSSNGEFIRQISGHNFRDPSGVTVSSDQIFVTDNEEHCVHIIDLGARSIRRFGSQGSKPGQLKWPYGIAVSQIDGSVYVADKGNRRIQVCSQYGDHVCVIGVGQLNGPSGIALDDLDNVYVTDFSLKVSAPHRVLVFTKDGGLIKLIGDDQYRFVNPMSICIDRYRGYIAVGDNNGVHIFSQADFSVVTQMPERPLKIKGIAVDSQARIVIANGKAHTISRWS